MKNKCRVFSETLVRTVYVFSTDIGMEFGIAKCGILNMNRGKVVRCEGTKLPNSEVMKEVEKEGCTYLEKVELDKIKEFFSLGITPSKTKQPPRGMKLQGKEV